MHTAQRRHKNTYLFLVAAASKRGKHIVVFLIFHYIFKISIIQIFCLHDPAIRAVHTFCPVATCLGINLEMAKSSEF